MIPFFKLHGLRNDFVLLGPEVRLESAACAALAPLFCDRRAGIGADGLVRLEETPDAADLRMRVWNRDGSETEACGNAVRCVGAWAEASGSRSRGGGAIRLATAAGERSVEVLGAGRHRAGLGLPELLAEAPVTLEPGPGAVPGLRAPRHSGWPVSVGNPHCVVPLDTVEGFRDVALGRLAAAARALALFPRGVNVSVIARDEEGRLHQRIDERGVGETPACGTGAVAAAVAARAMGCGEGAVTVRQPGGELVVSWSGPGAPAFVTGPAVLAYRGWWDGP